MSFCPKALNIIIIIILESLILYRHNYQPYFPSYYDLNICILSVNQRKFYLSNIFVLLNCQSSEIFCKSFRLSRWTIKCFYSQEMLFCLCICYMNTGCLTSVTHLKRKLFLSGILTCVQQDMYGLSSTFIYHQLTRKLKNSFCHDTV